jgi:hypothetical protein
MNKVNMQLKSLGTALALALSSAAAQDIALTGTVTDANGAKLKNAKVILLGRDIVAYTDANGVYKFESVTGIATRGAPAGAAGLSADVPRAEGASLRFGIHDGAQRVRISLYSMSGRLVHEVSDTRLGEGRYRVEPFRSGMAPGDYLARIHIGAARYSVTVPYLEGIASSRPSLRRSSESATTGALAAETGAPALRKISAVVDTISVVMTGYERGERTVESLSGTQDFKLNTLKWTNVSYRSGCGVCILDVRKPASGSKWPVIIHFHGGGMTGGDRTEPFTDPQYKQFGQKYLDHGYMVVMPGYTLAGGNTTVWPRYIRDAAQAAVWVRKNIEAFGGDPNSVFITGFSAGAYLTHMLAIDSTWFQELNYDPKNFAGFISMSGQTRTHDNIRADLKVSDIMKEKPLAMPMGHIHKTTFPWLITVGSLEGGTITSNQDMYNALIKAGSTDLSFAIIPNQPHTCADIADANSPKRDKIFAFVDKYKAK